MSALDHGGPAKGHVGADHDADADIGKGDGGVAVGLVCCAKAGEVLGA